jgi:hypothetical protein
MGLFDWLRRRLDAPKRSVEMVSYFDTEAKRVVRIPASELRPGVVQAQVQGIDELVWISPEQFHPGEIRHPPFDEDVRAYIRQIQEALTEQRPISFEEWEDGFRRDNHPEREIALAGVVGPRRERILHIHGQRSISRAAHRRISNNRRGTDRTARQDLARAETIRHVAGRGRTRHPANLRRRKRLTKLRSCNKQIEVSPTANAQIRIT